MLTDQRRYPRVARSFWLWFRPAASLEPWQVAPLRDVSVAGARFLSEHAFEAGTVLRAKLRLPTSRAAVPLSVRVAWSRPVEGSWNLTEHGVTFEVQNATVRQQMITLCHPRVNELDGGHG